MTCLRARQSCQKGCDASLEAIGLLQGRLRLVHLQTHLAQAKILDAEQTRKYEQLRGYGDDATPAHHLYSQYH